MQVSWILQQSCLELGGSYQVMSSARVRPRMSDLPARSRRQHESEITVDDIALALIGYFILACDADLEGFRLAYELHFIALLLGNRTFCALSLNLALFPSDIIAAQLSRQGIRLF